MQRITRNIKTDRAGVEILRKRRYARDADEIFWNAQEITDPAEREKAMDQWRVAKAAIRVELPYPE